MVWYAHLFHNFPQFIVIHTVKGFGIVNKAEIYVFLELSCFFEDPADVGNLISGSSAFSKAILNIWKFTVHILLKPGLENFEHYFASVWDECNCAVVWAFFGIALLWDWNENWPFPVLWPLLSFPNLLAYVCSTFTASSFRIWNSSTGIPSHPLALFVVMLSKAHLTSHSHGPILTYKVINLCTHILRWQRRNGKELYRGMIHSFIHSFIVFMETSLSMLETKQWTEEAGSPLSHSSHSGRPGLVLTLSQFDLWPGTSHINFWISVSSHFKQPIWCLSFMKISAIKL